jgi:phenol 2-monooxygenase (NADPH)
MFEAFGLAGRLVEEAYWVNEVSFWRPDPEDRTRIAQLAASRTPRRGCPSSRT